LLGGHANVLAGNNFGIEFPILKKSWLNISSNPGLLLGSVCNIFVIKFLTWSDITTWSGKVYAFILILLYVVLTSDVSNGGFPINKVYIITPIDHISTSYEWPTLPSNISGAI